MKSTTPVSAVLFLLCSLVTAFLFFFEGLERRDQESRTPKSHPLFLFTAAVFLVSTHCRVVQGCLLNIQGFQPLAALRLGRERKPARRSMDATPTCVIARINDACASTKGTRPRLWGLTPSARVHFESRGQAGGQTLEGSWAL